MDNYEKTTGILRKDAGKTSGKLPRRGEGCRDERFVNSGMRFEYLWGGGGARIFQTRRNCIFFASSPGPGSGQTPLYITGIFPNLEFPAWRKSMLQGTQLATQPQLHLVPEPSPWRFTCRSHTLRARGSAGGRRRNLKLSQAPARVRLLRSLESCLAPAPVPLDYVCGRPSPGPAVRMEIKGSLKIKQPWPRRAARSAYNSSGGGQGGARVSYGKTTGARA